MKPVAFPARTFRPAGFRLRLWLGVMVIVAAITAVVLYLAESNLEVNVALELHREFQASLAALDQLQELRHATLAERCKSLVGRSRIRAALEEAPDLLYPSAENDLSDLMGTARFYRFLDAGGGVIHPRPSPAQPAKPLPSGALDPGAEAQLALSRLTVTPQAGYLAEAAPGGTERVAEIIATPIRSTETGEVMAALVLGFDPLEGAPADPDLRNGLFCRGRLFAAGLGTDDGRLVAGAVARGISAGREESEDLRLNVGGMPQLMFYKRLNPGSLYPAAYEVALYSLAPLQLRQRQLRWQILGLGSAVLLAGLVASRFVTRRLSAPVEKLALDSERSARFSADASHQLKTPVTVLRAGLEEMLARSHFTPEECGELSELIHQTYRLSTLIDDLLLLSRMDSGRFKLDLAPVNLGELIAASVDDLGALPASEELTIETSVPDPLWIAGEKRYTAIILQNLLENARKYNRRGGSIRIAAAVVGETVTVSVGNTGQTIPAGAQMRIFERFHRGGIGENVPGYGLGLNLARELARIHGGELSLASSGGDWTQFELRFVAVVPAASSASGAP